MARIMGHQITNDLFDKRLGRGACFVAAVLVLALSLWKLARLDLTEAQLFFGVLLSLATPLLLIVIGLLLSIPKAAREP